MTRLASLLFATVFALSFAACEQHSADTLPPHYAHKMHHGPADAAHPPVVKEGETKDPNRRHEIPAKDAVKHP